MLLTALLLFVTGVLAFTALPLMQLAAGAADPASSMASGNGVAAQTGFLPWVAVQDASRLGLITLALPYTALAWGGLGWLSLLLAVRWQASACVGLMLAAAASLAASVTQAYGLPGSVWLGVGATWLALAAGAGLRELGLRRRQAVATPSPVKVRTGYVSLIWFLWITLTFIGLYWLLDISARGPHKLVYSGLHQLDALWLAHFVVMPAMTFNHPRLLKGLLGLRQAWHTPRGPWILCGALLVLMGAMVWLGRYAHFGAQQGYPHITAEGVRLLAGLSFAWVLSRYAEWGGSLKRRMLGAAALLILLIAALLTVGLIGDLGPILAISVALVPGILMLLIPPQSTRQALLSALLVTVGWCAILWLMRVTLVDWLPQLDWVPERLRFRVEAMLYPFAAHLDYVSQMRWLLEAAGANGFGLGAVPWCGASAHIDVARCTPFSGVPVQFVSDYVFVSTAATWGEVAAIVLVAATGVLILAVGASGAGGGAPTSGPKQSMHLLHRWICAVFAALAMGQLVVSVAGNSLFIPLSGVTQPLLGLGATSVLALAAWVGFALGGASRQSAPAQSGAAPKLWISSYASAMTVGIVVITAGLIYSNATQASAVKDQLVSKKLEHGLGIMACHLPSAHQSDYCKSFFEEPTSEPAANQSTKCVNTVHQATTRLAQWRTASALDDPKLELNCQQADDVLLALRWVKPHANTTLQNILSAAPKDLATQIAIRNPYRLPGCIYLQGAAPANLPQDHRLQNLCPGGSMDIQAVVPHTAVLNQKLASYTSRVRNSADANSRPTGLTSFQFQPASQAVAALKPPLWAQELGLGSVVQTLFAGNEPRSTTLGKGKDIYLTIHNPSQQTAQRVVECYSGKDCTHPNLYPRGGKMLEFARARMAGTLVVDAKTGHIEAAASAYTPCYQAQHQGIAKPDCLVLPEAPKLRAWMLNSRSLDATAMLGSETKIPMALGHQRSHSPLTLKDDKFEHALSHSETEKFIDDALCVDQHFAASCINNRLRNAMDAAQTLGWHTHCPPTQPGCANINLLKNLPDHSYAVPAASWMTNPFASNQTLLERFPSGSKKFTTAATKACYANNNLKRWRNCQGEGLVATVAELFGQGNATGSPVGVATGLLRLVNLAQGNIPTADLTPSLVRASSTVNAAVPVNANDRLAAQRILSALSKTTHPGGTAHVACLRALAAGTAKPGEDLPAIPSLADVRGSLIDCGQGGASQWVIAAKTGTPLFPHDDKTHQERLQHCRQVATMANGPARQYEWTRCQVAPSKWFAAVLGKKQGAHVDWQRVIIVLAERSWNAYTGKVDTPLDQGGNVAAEIAIATANALIH